MLRTVLALADRPDPGSEELMEIVDRMPARWRELVHEFGLQAVLDHYDGAADVDLTEITLLQMRERKQLQYAEPMFANVIAKRLAKYRNL